MQKNTGCIKKKTGENYLLVDSVNLSPGFKNEFYPLQRGFRSFVNSAWISRGFRVDTNKC